MKKKNTTKLKQDRLISDMHRRGYLPKVRDEKMSRPLAGPRGP